MNRRIISLWIVCSVLTSCRWHHEATTNYVCLLDISKSIKRESVVAEFNAMDSLVDRLKRGDALTLVPITSSAMADTPGRIVHLAAPAERQPYDHDLIVFRDEAHKEIKAMRDRALAEPANRTDILGALDAARQELSALPKENNRNLVVVSDFLEDDGTYNFVSAGSLASPARARQLAVRFHEQHGFRLEGVHVCLGRLESSDLAPLSAQRKEAVQKFWATYFAAAGEPAEIQFDGTGILTDNEGGCFGRER
jgi:hypothetical protein